jgi:cysteine synthase B
MHALTDHIGNTPLVELTKFSLPQGVSLWAKLEYFNPGGSVKDRAAWAIIKAAEDKGLMQPGVRLLDSSSGNTGIAYGMIAASRGHQLTLCLPRNANQERKRILKAYGVEIIETDPLEGSDGAIRKARELAHEFPGRYLYLDQYSNPANWQAHYEGTAEEIWRQTMGRISHWVAALGTTGTFTGTSRKLKELNPKVQCIQLQPDSPFHGLEGLKYLETSIVPGIYDASLADRDLRVPTEASVELVKALARKEGILAGISSGAALFGALKVASEAPAGSVVVTLFPDGGERYLSEERLWS